MHLLVSMVIKSDRKAVYNILDSANSSAEYRKGRSDLGSPACKMYQVLKIPGSIKEAMTDFVLFQLTLTISNAIINISQVYWSVIRELR